MSIKHRSSSQCSILMDVDACLWSGCNIERLTQSKGQQAQLLSSVCPMLSKKSGTQWLYKKPHTFLFYIFLYLSIRTSVNGQITQSVIKNMFWTRFCNIDQESHSNRTLISSSSNHLNVYKFDIACT